jgi:Domain of unknown function (DUF4232)
MNVVAPPPQDEQELLIREARARRRRRWTLVAAAVAVISGAAVATYSLADTGSSRVSIPGRAGVVGAPGCGGAELAVSFVRRGGVAMQEGGLLRFTNTGSAACRISGWPRVIAVTTNGRRVRAVHSLQSMLFATYWQHIPPVPRLTLRKGASGYAVLGSSATPIGRPAGWRCATARRLLVSPPGSRRLTSLSGLLWKNHGYPPAYLPLCGHQPWVEPIRPRPPLSH